MNFMMQVCLTIGLCITSGSFYPLLQYGAIPAPRIRQTFPIINRGQIVNPHMSGHTYNEHLVRAQTQRRRPRDPRPMWPSIPPQSGQTENSQLVQYHNNVRSAVGVTD